MIEFESGGEIQAREKEFPPQSFPLKIKVLGVGGAGCGILSRIYSEKMPGIFFAVCDSSLKSLSFCEGMEKILLGEHVTKGWGTGGDKELAKKICEEAEDRIVEVLDGAELLFVVCGLGRGVGTGASPRILKFAKKQGIVSMGFFILPFGFEGKQVILNSQEALEELLQVVDGAVIVSNDNLLRMEEDEKEVGSLSLRQVFTKVDDVFKMLLESIWGIFFEPGLINIDFADIKSFLARGKQVMITTAEASGERGIEDAVEKVLYSPLWGEIPFKKAKGMLVIIKSGEDFRLSQLERIIASLRKKADPSAFLSFGVYTKESLKDRLILTLMTSNPSSTESFEVKVEEEARYQQELKLGVYDKTDLDVPTFLRKKHI
ncbi:hypothetical protein H5U35_07670 [Candidatus Aerophobetes bacterium]|nr:hypothetical protein [Candidatus Aerophobetes bacterium]